MILILLHLQNPPFSGFHRLRHQTVMPHVPPWACAHLSVIPSFCPNVTWCWQSFPPRNRQWPCPPVLTWFDVAIFEPIRDALRQGDRKIVPERIAVSRLAIDFVGLQNRRRLYPWGWMSWSRWPGQPSPKAVPSWSADQNDAVRAHKRCRAYILVQRQFLLLGLFQEIEMRWTNCSCIDFTPMHSSYCYLIDLSTLPI